MKKAYNIWPMTKEEREAFQRRRALAYDLFNKNKTSTEVAKILGMKLGTVQQYAARWRKENGRPAPLTPNQLRKRKGLSLLATGLSADEVARRMGVTIGAVYHWRSLLGPGGAVPSDLSLKDEELAEPEEESSVMALHNAAEVRVTQGLPAFLRDEIEDLEEIHPPTNGVKKRSGKMMFLAFGPEDTVTLCLDRLAQIMGGVAAGGENQ